MIKVKISNKNSLPFAYTNFELESEADAYIEECKLNEHWGKSEKDIIIEAEVRDENGNVLKPAVTQHQDAEVFFEKEDITVEYNLNKLMDECEALGEQQESACFGCLRVLGGYNNKRNLSLDKILAMASTFSQVESMLNRRMPKTAKQLINGIVPDGELVTQELKDLLLNKLKEF